MELSDNDCKIASRLINTRIVGNYVLIDATAGPGKFAQFMNNERRVDSLLLFERNEQLKDKLRYRVVGDKVEYFDVFTPEIIRDHINSKWVKKNRPTNMVVFIHTNQMKDGRLHLTPAFRDDVTDKLISYPMDRDLYEICNAGISFIVVKLPNENYRFDKVTEVKLDIQYNGEFAIVSFPNYRRRVIAMYFNQFGLEVSNLLNVPFNNHTWKSTVVSLLKKYPDLKQIGDIENMDYLLSAIDNHIVDVPFGDRKEFVFTRSINGIDGRLPYQEVADLRMTLHWGQRKLLMSEIEFLTEYGDLSNVVVYAGAANGLHITYLSQMFPKHTFYLYDPNKFYIKENSKIKIFTSTGEPMSGYFTDKEASKPEYKGCLFISDIRRDNTNKMIDEDNKMQMGWVKLLECKKALLKWRTPFPEKGTPDIYPYLAGDTRLQCWAPPRSTETRLITDPSQDIVNYSKLEHEEKMNFFNTFVRRGYYPHSKDIYYPGLCHCYDCHCEIHILQQYINKFKPNKDVTRMILEISTLLKPRDFYGYASLHKLDMD